MSTPPLVLRGTAVHATIFGEIEFLEDRILVVSPQQQGGEIVKLVPGSEEAGVLQEFGLQPSAVTRLGVHELLVPGFIDLHLHAPQYSFAGTATDRPLLQWLDFYTFPREKAHANVERAATEYERLVRRLLSFGTTTAQYFSALELPPALMLAGVVARLGQRAYVGKTSMDRAAPAGYCHTTAADLAESADFIGAVRSLGTPLVQPVLTPRFVPTCTPELLAGLGQLAAREDVHIQSHISESLDVLAVQRAQHPETCGRDTPLYLQAGLLTDKTVMAHGTCLRDEELRVLAARGAALAHCPLSNLFFADILLRVNHARSLGIKVGLGTDVAGGYSPSMLSSMRTAVVTSRALRAQALRNADPTLSGNVSPEAAAAADAELFDYKGAFWLATVGGAQALGLQDTVATFAVGKQFDALRVDTGACAVFDVFEEDSLEDRFQKFINLGDDRNIKAVWVQGRQVLPAA